MSVSIIKGCTGNEMKSIRLVNASRNISIPLMKKEQIKTRRFLQRISFLILRKLVIQQNQKWFQFNMYLIFSNHDNHWTSKINKLMIKCNFGFLPIIVNWSYGNKALFSVHWSHCKLNNSCNFSRTVFVWMFCASLTSY